jgi:hypothetical protein
VKPEPVPMIVTKVIEENRLNPSFQSPV